MPSRVLVRTMALSDIINPFSGLIHRRLFGHHSSWNILLRVIEIPPSQIRYGLGVSQSVKLTSSGWELRG
jgi:hypothetical protein